VKKGGKGRRCRRKKVMKEGGGVCMRLWIVISEERSGD